MRLLLYRDFQYHLVRVGGDWLEQVGGGGKQKGRCLGVQQGFSQKNNRGLKTL